MQLDKLELKADERGTLVEAFKFPNDGQLMYIVVRPGEMRGNHYHLRKTEHFLVVYGSAEISVKDRETNDVMRVEVNGLKPMKVTVVPNHTHTIEASEDGCICLVWCDEQFNEEDPDTYKEEL